jgi:hypothetical protein
MEKPGNFQEKGNISPRSQTLSLPALPAYIRKSAVLPHRNILGPPAGRQAKWNIGGPTPCGTKPSGVVPLFELPPTLHFGGQAGGQVFGNVTCRSSASNIRIFQRELCGWVRHT